MVCTATIVLQSASVSSSNELELSLLTTTTLSARLIPARSRSSRLKIENIFVTVHCCYNIVDFLQTAHERNSASCHQQSPETKLRYHFFLVSAAVNGYMWHFLSRLHNSKWLTRAYKILWQFKCKIILYDHKKAFYINGYLCQPMHPIISVNNIPMI